MTKLTKWLLRAIIIGSLSVIVIHNMQVLYVQRQIIKLGDQWLEFKNRMPAAAKRGSVSEVRSLTNACNNWQKERNKLIKEYNRLTWFAKDMEPLHIYYVGELKLRDNP